MIRCHLITGEVIQAAYASKWDAYGVELTKSGLTQNKPFVFIPYHSILKVELNVPD